MVNNNEKSESPLIADEGSDGGLREGIDYYLENGLMVFTSIYLLKRGYCCERGCRHCPYGYSPASLVSGSPG